MVRHSIEARTRLTAVVIRVGPGGGLLAIAKSGFVR
jgi:hypothetical protein